MNLLLRQKNAGFHDLISENLKLPPEAKAADGEKYAQYAKTVHYVYW